MTCKEIHLFFYKQPGYKQLALEQQIAQQLSRLSPFLLSHNKKYRLRKSGVFKISKSLIININFES